MLCFSRQLDCLGKVVHVAQRREEDVEQEGDCCLPFMEEGNLNQTGFVFGICALTFCTLSLPPSQAAQTLHFEIPPGSDSLR